jgi:hypothetical protein
MKTPETERLPYEDMPYGKEKAFEHTFNYIEDGLVYDLEKEKNDTYDEFTGLITKRVSFDIFRHLLTERAPAVDDKGEDYDDENDIFSLPILLYVNKDKKIRIASDLGMFNFMYKGYETQEDIDFYNDLLKYAYKRGSLLFNDLVLIEKDHR